MHSLSLSHGPCSNVLDSTHSPTLSTSITTSVGAPLFSPLQLPSSDWVQRLVDQRTCISSFSVATIKQFDKNNWRVGGFFQLTIPEAIEPITAGSTWRQPGWEGMVTTGRGWLVTLCSGSRGQEVEPGYQFLTSATRDLFPLSRLHILKSSHTFSNSVTRREPHVQTLSLWGTFHIQTTTLTYAKNAVGNALGH